MCFNFTSFLVSIFDQIVFECPSEKIELSYGRLEVHTVEVGLNILFAAKRIEMTFSVSTQSVFVSVIQFECCVVHVNPRIAFGKVGAEPVQHSQ